MINPLIALAVATGFVVIIGLLFWPESGLIPRRQRTRRMTNRVRSEDALKHIHKWEIGGKQVTLESIAGTLGISMNDAATLLNYLQTSELAIVENGDIRLTPQGRDTALHVIRAHRLWEHYLAEETGYSEEVWHGQAEQFEHELTPAAANALAAKLGHPTYDPHGDPIPTASGTMVIPNSILLNSTEIDVPVRIVHVEDEPQVVYAQLVAEGLYPGQIVRVTESTAARVRFWSNGNEHILAPIVAANISVMPLTQHDATDTAVAADSLRLSALALGEMAEVIRLSPACRGAERRRFLDLGILPGTQVAAEMRSPSGDPTAYRIRGALIALRENQARLIQVRKACPELAEGEEG